MRGPGQDSTEERAAAPGTPVAAELPGGKVLARLHQLEQQRGLELTDITSPTAADGVGSM